MQTSAKPRPAWLPEPHAEIIGDSNPLFQVYTLLIYDDFDDDFYVHTPPPFAFIYAEARLCYGKNVRMGPKILSIGQKIIYTKLKSAIVST